MLRRVLHSLMYFPARTIDATPAAVSRDFRDVDIETDDGERLHGWWVPGAAAPVGHVLLCHGNAGNVGDRVLHAALLTAAGFDVLLFDYRGYGRSSGRPSEHGTYRDARAARRTLIEQARVDPSRVLYVGESLGGAVAVELALEFPPAGLVLQSTFTSVRDLARMHYAFIPAGVVPDAYPSLARIPRLQAALLVLHGDSDEIVPLAHGRALFAAAGEPKRIQVVEGAGHNDLVTRMGEAYGQLIAAWATETAYPDRDQRAEDDGASPSDARGPRHRTG
jgi:fermentation-respiration switch protein FrsA (DUF1100 family)